MFAVVKTGGKQYKVQNNDIISVENLNLEEGSEFKFEEVLFVQKDDGSVVFNPTNETIKGFVVNNFRGKKVIAFKNRRRHTYKKKVGHRQYLTKVKVVF